MTAPSHPTPACSSSCLLVAHTGADSWRGPDGYIRTVIELGQVDGKKGRWFVMGAASEIARDVTYVTSEARA